VLVELTYAYVVGRVDISYAVTLLARYSSAPDRCHYLALKRLCKFRRRTIDWGILSAGDFKTLSIDNKDLPEFPKFSNLMKLVGYVRLRVKCRRPTYSSIGDWPIILPLRRCCRLHSILRLDYLLPYYWFRRPKWFGR
jgi:hypothetical protein